MLSEWISEEELAAAGPAFGERVGRQFASVEVAAENLMRASRLLVEYDASHYLVFGTLLGAVRDGGLIPHDTDVDLAVLGVDRPKLEAMLRDGAFARTGLYVSRLHGDSILSVMRGGEYVDIYVFDREPADADEYRCLEYSLPVWQLDPPGHVELYGRTFATVRDPVAYFVDKYGSDWRTPIAGRHAST